MSAILKYHTPKWFHVQELVPPDLYEQRGEAALVVMDYRMLKTADQIREFFMKPVTINNWAFGGERIYSGWRPFECQIGAKLSQHRFGRAIDFVVEGIAPEIVRSEIMGAATHFTYITTIEAGTPTWTHVDCRAIASNGIELVGQ